MRRTRQPIIGIALLLSTGCGMASSKPSRSPADAAGGASEVLPATADSAAAPDGTRSDAGAPAVDAYASKADAPPIDGGVQALDAGTEAASLAGLGVNTQLGPRTDSTKKPLPAGYHPLRRPIGVIAPLKELYLVARTINGKQGLFEDARPGDGVTDFTPLYSDAALKSGLLASGDVDGDGLDEVITIEGTTDALTLHLFDRDSGGKYASKTIALGKPPGYAGKPSRSTTLDIDGDGRDEVALTTKGGLFIFDDASKSFALLAQTSYAELGGEDPAVVMTAGDVDGDGPEELLVATCGPTDEHLCEYFLYDSQLNMNTRGIRPTLTMTVAGVPMPMGFKRALIALGDVDRDGRDELVFALADAFASTGSVTYKASAPVILVLDDRTAGFKQLGSLKPAELPGIVDTLDVDHDGKAEILWNNHLLELDQGELVERQRLTTLLDTRVIGDIDGDFRDEVIVHNFRELDDRRENWLEVWGMNAAGSFVMEQRLSIDDLVIDPTDPGKSYPHPNFVLANMDNDSLVVKYKAHELAFSAPRALAALAAPPFHAGLGQNLADTSTTFGRSEGGEVVTSRSLGFSAGTSIGASVEMSILGVKLGGVETTVSFNVAQNVTATESQSQQCSYSFSGGAEEDKVVFTSVPYDVYSYEVLAAEDPLKIGEVVTINLPRDPQTFSVSRAYYNANNGTAPDIDESILAHTIGSPSTYPTVAKRDELMKGKGWYNPTTMTVGQGSGWQTLTINVDEKVGKSLQTQMTLESEMEVTVGVVKGGVSTSMTTGVGSTLTASQGFFVEGRIGDLPASSYGAGTIYRAGLFAYPARAKSQDLIVVNYWVE